MNSLYYSSAVGGRRAIRFFSDLLFNTVSSEEQKKNTRKIRSR